MRVLISKSLIFSALLSLAIGKYSVIGSAHELELLKEEVNNFIQLIGQSITIFQSFIVLKDS